MAVNINSAGEVYAVDDLLGTVSQHWDDPEIREMARLWEAAHEVAKKYFRVYGILRNGQPEVTIEVELTLGSQFHADIGIVDAPFDEERRKWIVDRSEWIVALMEERGYRAYTEEITEGGELSGIGIHAVVPDAEAAPRMVDLLHQNMVRLGLEGYTF